MRLGEKASQVQKNMKINKTANMQRSPKVSLTLRRDTTIGRFVIIFYSYLNLVMKQHLDHK